ISDIVEKFRNRSRKKLFEKWTKLVQSRKELENDRLVTNVQRRNETCDRIEVEQDSVVDFSSKKINEQERSLLRRGLSFIPTRPLNSTTYVSKVIAGVETGIYKKSLGDKEDIVSEVKRVLEQLGFDKTGISENLSKSQRKAIKTLKEDENIIIIPADKGGKVVVMNVEDYIKKIKEKLDTKAYQKLEDSSKGIYKRLEILLSELVGKQEIDRDEMNMMLENKNLPFVRGQLKVHKEDKSMRLIVSMRETMGSSIAKYIMNITKSLADNARSVKNTEDLINKLYKLKVKKRSKLASLDVSDLFTSVDRKKVLDTFSKLLDNDESWKTKTSLRKESLIKLVEFCIENVSFQFGNNFYKQIKGLPMGCTISPFLADIALNEFLLYNWDYQKYPYIGLARYVDDILLVSKMEKKEIQELVTDLNRKNDLQFTFEYEVEHKIAFLDVSIQINQISGTRETSWFRKPTASSKALNFDSDHSYAMKQNIVTNMVKRITIKKTKEICLVETNLK
ncbi:unnamed protein product, partial [Didymodactylos carnosus]